MLYMVLVCTISGIGGVTMPHEPVCDLRPTPWRRLPRECGRRVCIVAVVWQGATRRKPIARVRHGRSVRHQRVWECPPDWRRWCAPLCNWSWPVVAPASRFWLRNSVFDRLSTWHSDSRTSYGRYPVLQSRLLNHKQYCPSAHHQPAERHAMEAHKTFRMRMYISLWRHRKARSFQWRIDRK